jgi:hypothetical protein
VSRILDSDISDFVLTGLDILSAKDKTQCLQFANGFIKIQHCRSAMKKKGGDGDLSLSARQG